MALELLNEEQRVEVADTALDGLIGPADADVFYTVRPIPIELNRQMRRKHTKVSRPNGIREETFDESGFYDDALDYVLVEWRGLTVHGQPAPCTRENKVKGLDGHRKNALLILSGINRPQMVAEARERSFRIAQ
jgi:hypothetical protein